jgi:hypothetical protein
LGKNYYVNPNPFPVICGGGDNEFSCLDAETGKMIWQLNLGYKYGPNVGTASAPALIAPDMGHPIAADGKVFGLELAQSCHTGIGSSRAECDPLARYPSSIPKYHISFDWYPGYVYCFGPGPVALKVSTDKIAAASGETVTVSGTAIDMSPNDPGIPATGLPVTITAYRSDGTTTAIATVKTGTDGTFSVPWKPSSGVYRIVAGSPGSASYEKPDDAATVVSISGSSATSSLFQAVTAVLAMGVIAIMVAPIHKSKSEVDQP